MSWLFSQALVAGYSAGTCSDGELFAQLNVKPTPQPFWRNDKTMDICARSPFGLTCAVLTDDRGEELLTLFLAGFHAKTSVLPEAAQDSTEPEAGCGRNLRGSLARYDRDSHSLKTVQDSLFSDLIESSPTLPRSGTMRNGECYQQPTLGPITIEKDSGFSLEKFPTPTVCGNYNRKGASATSGDGLATYVRKYPTPTASACRGWSPGHNRAETNDRIDYTIEREAHQSGKPGRLNPMWEEWLMAWPIGWTQLKPLETVRFLLWQQQHSPSYAGEGMVITR